MTTGNKAGVVFSHDGAIFTVGNGKVIHYQRINGIYYHANTPADVVRVLEQVRSSQRRIRLYYGDPTTGRDWLQGYDVEGHINNSIGPLKVPLLLENRQSCGGPALLDHCVVKIKSAGRNNTVLYQHLYYHAGMFTIRVIGPNDICGNANLCQQGYTHAVDVDGSNHANFRSLGAAEQFIHKMTD